jgi:hypothetical protein
MSDPELWNSILEYLNSSEDFRDRKRLFLEYLKRCPILWDKYGFIYMDPDEHSIHIYVTEKHRGDPILWLQSIMDHGVIERALNIGEGEICTWAHTDNPAYRLSKLVGFEDTGTVAKTGRHKLVLKRENYHALP